MATALREWAVELTPQLTVLPAPELADEEPQEDGVLLQPAAIWQIPDPPADTLVKDALLADFRLVIEKAAAFSMEHLCDIEVLYGCLEVGYIRRGVAEPRLIAFFEEPVEGSTHDHS